MFAIENQKFECVELLLDEYKLVLKDGTSTLMAVAKKG